MIWTPTKIALAAIASAVVLGSGGAAAGATLASPAPAAAVSTAPSAAPSTTQGTPAPPAPPARPAPAPTKTIIEQRPVIVQAPPAPAAAQPASALRYVGNGIYAGSNTSDAFAQAVVAAWSGTPGVQYVYSPVTGQTYAMTYQIVGAGTVIATGGNGAYVQF
jgi:hypothetical protein